MANPGLIKTYDAGAAIAPYTIVKLTTTDFQALAAAAATDPIIGVTTEVNAASGDRVDVVHNGIAYVTAGGAIAAGDALTSDANGHAITTVTANNRTVGFARQSAVAGDVFEALIAPAVY
ncbi:MAG: DUF2190 family protein [Proteobacteria bacterium]|nr:DUF2190 family protein [Pseudomonadota bacterium]